MPIPRFAMSLPGVMGTIQGALNKADRALGGWLPGGGVASPATRAIQAVTPSSREVVRSVRDNVVVPVLDKAIGAGVVPVKEAMFARYLTGTGRPLTQYPERERSAISKAFDNVAIDQTRGQVDEIFKSESPLYRQYVDASSKVSALEGEVRDRAEAGQGGTAQGELSSLGQLRANQERLRQQLGLSQLDALAGGVKLSDEARLEIIRRHGLARREDVTVSRRAAYGGALPEDVELSLGSFEVRNGEIRDRYKFDGLQDGRTYPTPDGGMAYPDALGGGKLASDLIELGLKTGVITPHSGYDVRVPLKR